MYVLIEFSQITAAFNVHVDEEGFVLVGSEHSECWYIDAADQIHHFGFLLACVADGIRERAGERQSRHPARKFASGE